MIFQDIPFFQKMEYLTRLPPQHLRSPTIIIQNNVNALFGCFGQFLTGKAVITNDLCCGRKIFRPYIVPMRSDTALPHSVYLGRLCLWLIAQVKPAK
jgi:hypothetical protein